MLRRVVKADPEIKLPDLLPVEQVNKPEWFRVREKIVRSGTPSLVFGWNGQSEFDKLKRHLIEDRGLTWVRHSSLDKIVGKEATALGCDEAILIKNEGHSATVKFSRKGKEVVVESSDQSTGDEKWEYALQEDGDKLSVYAKPDRTRWLLDTLRKTVRGRDSDGRGGRWDFITAFGVIGALPDEIPTSFTGDVLEASKRLSKIDESCVVISGVRGLVKVAHSNPKMLEEAVDELIKIGGNKEHLHHAHQEVIEAFAELTAEHPDEAIPILQSQVGGNNSDLKEDIAQALERAVSRNPGCVDQILPTITALVDDEHHIVKTYASEALREALASKGVVHPEEAVPELIRYAGDGDKVLRRMAAESLGVVGSKNPGELQQIMSELKRLCGDEDKEVLKSTALALGEIGSQNKNALPEVKKLLTSLTHVKVNTPWPDEKDDVRRGVAKAYGKIGINNPKAALPPLIEFSESLKGRGLVTVVESLVDIGIANPSTRKIQAVLKQIHRDIDGDSIRYLAEIETLTERLSSGGKEGEVAEARSEDVGQHIQRLLSYRETPYATPELEVADERMNDLTEITQELMRLHPRVSGLMISGGLNKGYTLESSDVDCGVLGEDINEEIEGTLSQLAKSRGIDLCGGHHMDLRKIKRGTTKWPHILFSTTFIGDRDTLREAQLAYLEKKDETQWDLIRANIIHENTDPILANSVMDLRYALEKLNTWGVRDEEITAIGEIKTILYTPPDLETMKEELRW